MGKVIASFTMSLDGFIAGPNDEVGRLFDNLGGYAIDLEKIKVIDTPDVTHLHFRVVK
jgi:hypothetical protein